MAKVRNRKRHLQGKPETASIPVVSIGEKLRHARDARGLDVATVAEALHLKQAMVVALENEDFEKLPARVFVRGYYRNYVRFLELPEQALMKEFDELCPEGDNCSGAPPVVAQNVRKEVRSSHALVRLMTWLVVISVFAAFALWWKDYSGKKAAEVAQVAPSQDVGEEGGAARVPDTSLAGAGPVARESSAPPVAEQAKEEQAKEEQAKEEQAKEEQAKEEQVVEVAEVADTSPATVAEPSIPEPTAGSKVVELRFSEDSWVDVRGADGSFKVVGTRKAGETLRLGGKPPYHIILGNARGVSLLVNGTPHDLAASTRRNVARLTLDL